MINKRPEEARPAMTPKEREIALAAIGARVSGYPAEAATQILAGLAVLDAGPEQPVVVLWPKEFEPFGSLLERAAWHESERSRLIAREASNREASTRFWAGVGAKQSGADSQDPDECPAASAPRSAPESAAHLQATASDPGSLAGEHQEAAPLSTTAPR